MLNLTGYLWLFAPILLKKQSLKSLSVDGDGLIVLLILYLLKLMWLLLVSSFDLTFSVKTRMFLMSSMNSHFPFRLLWLCPLVGLFS